MSSPNGGVSVSVHSRYRHQQSGVHTPSSAIHGPADVGSQQRSATTSPRRHVAVVVEPRATSEDTGSLWPSEPALEESWEGNSEFEADVQIAKAYSEAQSLLPSRDPYIFEAIL